MKRRVEKPCACYLCGRNGSADPLDKHHIFPGANRSNSEKYGAVVYLCHERCHIFGQHAVHVDAEVSRRLKEDGQRAVMRSQKWSIADFRAVFGVNYLDDEQEEQRCEPVWEVIA